MKTRKLIVLLMAAVMLLGLLSSCARTPASSGTSSAGQNPTTSGTTGGSTTTNPGTAGGNNAVTGPSVDEQRRGGVLNVAWKGNGSDSLDPYFNTGWLTYIWSLNVFETAISRDADGNYTPCVCNFDLSEDRLTLKLWVRDGVTFHDGTAVTIDDVVYSIYTHMKDTDSNLNKYFIQYVDDYSVEDGVATFHFKKYNASTLYYISGYGTFTCIMPKWILEKVHEAMLTDEDAYRIVDLNEIIGTGPYKLNVKESELGRCIVLDRYDGYVPVEGDYSGIGGPKKAYMDRINVFFNSEVNSISMSLMSGDYDVASVSGEFAELLKNAGLSSTQDLGNNITYVAFNTSEGHVVTDQNLRKAIAAALDYESILKVAVGEGFYTLDNCPMAQGAYYTTAFHDADYFGAANLALAQQYLAASNYQGEVIKIASKSTDRTGVVIESLIKAAGINCEIEYIDDASFNSYYSDVSNDYDILFLSSAKCDSVPSSLVTNLRVRFWNDDEAAELFSIIGSSVAGSKESLEAWEKMYTKWVDDAHILPIGATQGMLYHDPDLNVNAEGTWRYFFNAYWNNPSEHME